MRGKSQKYLLLLLMLILSGCADPPVDWRRTFRSADKIPFGTYILRNELNRFFPDAEIHDITEHTGDFLESAPLDYDELYIHISDGDNKDRFSWESILDYVKDGGTAFVATSSGNSVLDNELGLKINDGPLIEEEESVKLSVAQPDGSTDYIFQKGIGTSYIVHYNPNTTEIIGHLSYQGKTRPNLAAIQYGRGTLVISTEPVAFTNYHMLKKDHYRYIEDVFSYLEPGDILWDNVRMYSYTNDDDYKGGGAFETLSFILKNESLRKAFLLLLVLGLLYLLFNTRRKQRPVPIIHPYKNYKLDFAKTLAELYRYEADHTAMVKYKIRYFMEQLRQNYNITAKDTEEDFSELLAAKSGADLQLCNKLVTRLGLYRQREYHDREDFIQLQSLIHQFNQKTAHHGRKPE